MVTIGEIVQQVFDRVLVDSTTEYKLIGVKWYGEGTFHRETVLGEHISAKYLTPVRPNAFIYNRLFAWKASFAVVPFEHEGFFVSNEFPQFIVDSQHLLPEYLYRYFMLDRTLAAVSAASVGSAAVSRNRFKEEEFTEFEIPVPPMDVQRAIVAHWQRAREDIRTAESRSNQLKSDLMQGVRERLGRIRLSEVKRPKAFALSWKALDRWGVELAWKTQTPQTVDLYPTTRLASICQVSSGGTPSRKYPAYFGGEIPWVKTTEVRDDVILTTEETLTHEGLKHSSARIYPAGSLIVAMYGQGATRGRTAKLGIDSATNQACAVLTDFDQTIEPDFLWYYLMSEYDDLRAMASGNNQPNLNAAMIANYPVPLPPLSVQREMIQQIESGRSEAARLRNLAAQIRTLREAEVEAMILGTMPVTTA